MWKAHGKYVLVNLSHLRLYNQIESVHITWTSQWVPSSRSLEVPIVPYIKISNLKPQLPHCNLVTPVCAAERDFSALAAKRHYRRILAAI